MRSDTRVAKAAMEDDSEEVSFLQNGFCQVGLPLRKPHDGAVWNRHNGAVSLTIKPYEDYLPDGTPISVGVPYGPKARLLLMYFATHLQAHGGASDDRWIEFGPITKWLREVGIAPTGGRRGSIRATKDQLLRLSLASFSLITDHLQRVHFRNEPLVAEAVYDKADIEAYLAGDIGGMEWPHGVKLSETAYQSFLRYVTPITSERLRLVADSAMAIDLFSYLAHTLPRLPDGTPQHVTWGRLREVFGSSGYDSVFRREYQSALQKAVAAYPEADIEEAGDGNGLVLRRSDPPVPRSQMVSVLKTRKPRQQTLDLIGAA